MNHERTMNRWVIVVAAIMIQLALGAIYAWGLFVPKLQDPDGIYRFTATQTAWIFSTGLATFSVVMVLAGRLQAGLRNGPRKIAVTGGIFLGLGYILAGLFGTTFWNQVLFIGILAGAGIGLAYVVPIAVLVKWFPDKKGLITGIAVAGFGFGATIWVKAGKSWFHLVDRLHILGLPPVQSTFLLYGAIFLSMVVLGGILMIDPPEGWQPAGWTPPESDDPEDHGSGTVDFETGEMLLTPQFYLTFSVFVLSALSGLMVIYALKPFGIDSLRFAQNISPDQASVTAGTALAFYAIFNGLGRIAWGWISDRIGRRNAIVAMTLFQAVAMAILYYIGATSLGLIMGASIIGFNFGGNFALFPAITADFFGNRTLGQNYGWVFLAYGVAGILGPQLAGHFKDTAMGASDPSLWLTPFLIGAAGCLGAAMLMLVTPPPRKSHSR